MVGQFARLRRQRFTGVIFVDENGEGPGVRLRKIAMNRLCESAHAVFDANRWSVPSRPGFTGLDARTPHGGVEHRPAHDCGF